MFVNKYCKKIWKYEKAMYICGLFKAKTTVLKSNRIL